MRLEHHIELLHLTPLGLTAFWTGNSCHLIVRVSPTDLVGTKSRMTTQALDERVRESSNVAGGFPDFRIHQDSSIDTVHIIAVVAEHLEPETLDVFLQDHPERAIVVGAGEAAAYLGPQEDEPAALREGDYLFHQILVSHTLHHCTTAFAATYPGSPLVSVVTGSAVTETCTPAKRSYPENDAELVSAGAVPLCDVEGVSDTWKVPCALPPCVRSPVFQVTVRDETSYENAPAPAVSPV